MARQEWRQRAPLPPEATTPPRILRRPTDAPRPSAAAWPSTTSPKPTPVRADPFPSTHQAKSSATTPPRSRSESKLRECSAVPDTPESLQGKPTPPPRSFAAVVRSEAPPVFNAAPPKAPATKLKSTITVPERSTYFPGSSTPPRRGTAQSTRGTAALRETAARRHHTPSAATARGAFNSPAADVEEGWTKVKEPYWWRKCRDSTYQGAQHLRRHQPSRSREQNSSALRVFRERTHGRCFICLTPGHRAAGCRAQYRCFNCNRSGHRARACTRGPPHQRQHPSPPLKSPPLQGSTRRYNSPSPATHDSPALQELPPPPKPTPGARMSRLGDPATRPEAEDCLVQSTRDIDDNLREWDTTGAVTWAVRGPDSTGPKEVEAAIREEFNLRHDEVKVTSHFPESFLIKFKYARHCEVALEKGSAKRRGIEVYFIKWRSLRDAEGVALLFRVKLCLDGVPRHAWSAELAERIISRTCALERIETNLDAPEDTKTIDLWAWTANPSTISKVVWLTFTGRARDPRLASVQVSEIPPERWQRGVKHPVIVHLEEYHDYTAASVNLDDRSSCKPPTRKLPPWRLGVIDGETVPRRDLGREGQHPAPARDGERSRQAGRDSEHRLKDKDEERPRRGYNNDHPRWNVWRRKDDHDDERDGRGRDHGDRRGKDDRRGDARETFRERERSPRRRNWGGSSSHGGRRHDDEPLKQNAVPPQQLPSLLHLRTREVIELQFLFANQASTIQEAARNYLNGNRLPGVPDTHALNSLCNDYIRKAAALADKLQLHDEVEEGDEAWSGASAVPGPCLVPVADAFRRILTDLPPPSPQMTIRELDAALHHISLSNNYNGDISLERPPSPIQATPAPLDGSFVDLYKKARRLYAPEATPTPEGTPVNLATGSVLPASMTPELPPSGQASDSNILCAETAAQHQETNDKNGLQSNEDTPAPAAPALLDCLFVTPTPSLLNNVVPMPALRNHDAILQNGDGPNGEALTAPVPAVQAKRQRRRRGFDMTAEFLAMFQGPLPHYIVAALTAAFNLDDDGAEELDEALAAVAGDAIHDLQDEAANIQVQAQATAA